MENNNLKSLNNDSKNSNISYYNIPKLEFPYDKTIQLISPLFNKSDRISIEDFYYNKLKLLFGLL